MWYIIFALMLGLACPSGSNSNQSNGTVYSTNGGGDEGGEPDSGEHGTGGDTGQIRPKP